VTPEDLASLLTPETLAAMLADAPLLVVVFFFYVRPWMRRIEAALVFIATRQGAQDTRITRVEQAAGIETNRADEPTPRLGVRFME